MSSRTPNHASWFMFHVFRKLPFAHLRSAIGFLLFVVFLAACSRPGPVRETPVPTTPTAVNVTATLPPQPTATPLPLPPALVESLPPAGAEVPLQGSITLYFNQPMERASVESALSGLPATFRWADDFTLSLIPAQPLVPASEINLILGTTARAANGLSLPRPLDLTFRTAGYLKLSQRLPEPGAAEVDPTSAVVAAFTRPVVPLGADPASLPPAFTLTPSAAGQGEWLNTSTYVFYPQPGLAGGATYTVNLNPALTGVDGSPLESVESWSFDTAFPRLLSLEPEAYSSDVRLDTAAKLTFNQPMDAASVQANFAFLDTAGTPLAGQFAWNDDFTTLWFTPTVLLKRDQVYSVNLSAQAQAAGGTALGQGASAAFYTVAPLTVTGSKPPAGGQLLAYHSPTVYFNAPISNKDILQFVTLTPPVANLRAYADYTEPTLWFHGNFTPEADYLLTLSPNLPDIWNGRLGKEFSLRFRTAPLDPNLMVTGGGDVLFITPQDSSLTVQATNLDRLPILLGSLPLDDFQRMIGPDSYDFRQNYRPAQKTEFRQDLDLQPNRSQTVDVPLAWEGQPLSPNLYYLRFMLSSQRFYVSPLVLVVSNVHLTYKLSAADALVWAVDLRDDRPVAGAPVAIYTAEGTPLANGQTDAEGVFRAALSRPVSDPWVTTYALLGQPGEEQFALALSNWNQGIDPWEFGLSADYSAPRLQTYLYTDRPIYRPGQTVYFRAVARQAFNGRYTFPEIGSLTFKLFDGYGKELTSFGLPLSAYGTAHGEYTLPESAPPGYYRLESQQADYSGVSFQVAEYRKPEINLQVGFEAGLEASAGFGASAGESLTALVNARYFFDAPAGNLAVHWELFKEPSYFILSGYRVGKEDDRWLTPYPRMGYLGELVAQGDSQTAPDGMLALEVSPPPADSRQRYTLEVTAHDESGLPVSARASVEVNPAEIFIGVRPESWVSQAGEQTAFQVLAVDWESNPAGARALHAEFQKVVWERVEPENPHEYPSYISRYTPVASQDFSTNADGLARIAFTPPEPGSYRLSLSGAQATTQAALTEVTVWVGGPGQASWPNLPNQRLRLTADRASYNPGDTAQVFIPNPFGAGAKALVTVERGVVLSHRVLTFGGVGETLALPLSAEDAPNVYVAVTLLGQAEGNRPDFRQGYLNLPVAPLEQTLNVTLIGEPQRAGPGDEVTFEVRVTDHSGAPVQGEFSLAVVDLAALALADPNAPDILPAFYGEQPLGVRTGVALSASPIRQASFRDGMGGGGAMEGAMVVREKFPDTAFWNAEILTDAEGKAQVTLTLPDSLTTWQVDLRGLTSDTRVGQAKMQIVATKELLIRPVTPRFLVVGDHALLAAIVQNNTANDLTVDVSLQSSGFTLDDPAAALQTVRLPAYGRARLEWWGTAQDVAVVDVVFAANGGGYSDATRPANGALPVLRYTAPQTFGTSGILDTGGELLELVSLPRSFDPQGGGLRVQLSPSLAAAILESLESLDASNRYDCTEQLLSRLLPNLETYRILQDFGLDDAELKARLENSLATDLPKWLARQNEDGGWGWWSGRRAGEQGSRGAGESDAYITAYVLFGLSRARGAGIGVDENIIQGGINYLRAVLPSPRMLKEGWQFDRLAFQHFALAQAGAGDLGGAATLYAERARLAPWAKAFLALTLESLAPGDERARTLFSDLQAGALRSASGAHWENAEPDWRNMSTPIHATAVVLYALAQHDPAAPLTADAARYLMAHRRASGGWSSTYETAWTLLALGQLMKGTGELGGNFTFSAALNGAPLARGQAGGDTQLTPITASAPLGNLQADSPNALLLQRSAGPGRLYYSAHLTVNRPVEEVAPLDRGISLFRAYYAAPAQSEIQNLKSKIRSARAGDRVTVRLTLTVPETRYYLLVEDYIPAGAEVLDTSLKTSQLGAVEIDRYNPRRPFADGWGWWYFSEPQVYDDHIAWAAETLPPGSYELTYTWVILQPGEYRVLPARAWQFYFPEVQGNSAGEVFRIEK